MKIIVETETLSDGSTAYNLIIGDDMQVAHLPQMAIAATNAFDAELAARRIASEIEDSTLEVCSVITD